MKFIKFQVVPCSLEEFITFWAGCYDVQKYPDKIYEQNLNRGALLEEENILPLLRWKNGNKPTTGKIASNVIKNLAQINKFRELNEVTNGVCKNYWAMVSSFIRLGIVLKIFIFHIARPFEYPMVDQHVLRAYYYMTHGEVKEPAQTLDTYWVYKDFFASLKEESGKDVREVDKALMAYGQFLKSQFFQAVPKMRSDE